MKVGVFFFFLSGHSRPVKKVQLTVDAYLLPLVEMRKVEQRKRWEHSVISKMQADRSGKYYIHCHVWNRWYLRCCDAGKPRAGLLGDGEQVKTLTLTRNCHSHELANGAQRIIQIGACFCQFSAALVLLSTRIKLCISFHALMYR